jgi:hypothetical protein
MLRLKALLVKYGPVAKTTANRVGSVTPEGNYDGYEAAGTAETATRND